MENQVEIWKPINGFEKIYEVSNFGRVKSISRIRYLYNGAYYINKEIILKQTINTTALQRHREYQEVI